jgi:citrate lyase beta subunit
VTVHHPLARDPHALQTLDFGRSERAVRINALGTGLAVDDVNGVLSRDILPGAVVVPKTDDARVTSSMYSMKSQKSTQVHCG